MSQIAVTINGRDYQITCDDGMEDHLRRLAGYVDSRVKELVAAEGQIGDTRLLVMASLLVADALSEAQHEIETLRANGEAGTADPPDPAANSADTEALVRSLEALAQRIETVAAGLERS